MTVAFTLAAVAADTAQPVQSDQEARAVDPALYATARQYFPSDAAAAPGKRVVRLTREQIDATVAAILPGAATRTLKSVMDGDPLHTNYEYADGMELNSANIGQYSRWVAEVVAAVKKNPKLAADCSAEGNSQECQSAAVRRFVARAFRNDVPDTEVDKFVAFYLAGLKSADAAQATADLVEVVLKYPDFLFHKEFGGDRRGQFSPPQRLTALAYVLADSPPEALGAGRNEALSPPQAGQIGATVNAILTTTPAREKLVRFFKAWLEVKQANEFTISTELYKEFDDKLRAAMLAETDQFLRAELIKPQPSLKAITQATQTAVPKGLEKIYGAKTADPGQRLGIFSQPAVLVSHSGPTDSRPIKRGVFWVRKLMCMELGAQPTDIKIEPLETPKSGTSQRQLIEQTTKAEACVGCHKVINPFGFFQESYDALGRWRTTDNGVPVDSSISINFLDEEPNKTSGPVEAIKTFTNSQMFKQCFVRQMFRFYMGRDEEPSDDPVLRRMFFEFARSEDQDILKPLQILASSDRVLKRQ